jgi:hypothetical protein
MDLIEITQEAESMFFSAYCPQVGAEVLLGPDNVIDLDHGPLGIELHYRCHCGQPGVLYPQQDKLEKDAPRRSA